MANGQTLTNDDRWDWLILLREKALTILNFSRTNGVIITFSALKRKYRDVMRVATYYHPQILVHFVFLRASEDLLTGRVRARKGHFMKDDMVRSQLQSLEIPQSDESDVLSVDASGTLKEVQQLAVHVVNSLTATDTGKE